MKPIYKESEKGIGNGWQRMTANVLYLIKQPLLTKTYQKFYPI